MVPIYDLNKIKFATDEAMFKRVVGLCESGKLTEVESLGGYYFAATLVADFLRELWAGKILK